jgi:DNA-binding IclR family transcriptional regulator
LGAKKGLTVPNKTYQVPAVVKALDILEYLGKNGESSFTEIYTALEIPKSSAFQILTTLKSYGYVRHAGQSSKYSLGFRLYDLGTQAVSRLDIRAEAAPLLRELMMKTGQMAILGIQDGQEGIYLAMAEGNQTIRIHSWEGMRFPLHSTALGKALLAWQKEEDLDSFLRNAPLARYTERTLTRASDLKKHLQQVRKQGWALDDREDEPNIRCLGAPVRNIKGEVVAAVSICGLAADENGDRKKNYPAVVIETARQLSLKIGGKLSESQ